MGRHRSERNIFLFLSILMTVCILSGCSNRASNLAEGVIGCEKTKKAAKQLEKMYDLSVQFADRIAESWDVYMDVTLGKGLPDNIGSLLENAPYKDTEYVYYEKDFDDEVTLDDIAPEFADRKFIAFHYKIDTMRMLGDFYARLPLENRARTFDEAGAVLFVDEVFEKRDDYSGTAYNRNYYVYIISLDSGNKYTLAEAHNSPPLIGQGKLYGNQTTMEKLWNDYEVGDMLNYLLSEHH